MHPRRIHLSLALCLLLASALQACDGCNTRALRRFGSTCGTDSECAGGVCFRGKCTKSCKASSECAGGICIAEICQTADDDYDGDGLSNGVELSIGTNPQKKDSDGDGLSDKVEIGSVTNPKDTNNDGKIDAVQSNKDDLDGDCMVDAYDINATDPSQTGLPAVADYCDTGVCADHLADVTLICDKNAPTYAGVVLGCAGCQCKLDAAKVPEWQGAEVYCDNLDNDCDGLTDEDLVFNKKKVGQACVGIYGICAQVDDNGRVPKGVVECGTDKQITCSVHGNGSQSVAQPERCNYVDDNCDGVSDEGFTWKANAGAPALATGQACDVCGSKTQTCADGSPANPPRVACSGDGGEAVCSAVPYDLGFVERSAGRPQPRLRWSVGLGASDQKLYVYGGAVPTPLGPRSRAELWTLDVGVAVPATWTHVRDQAPGALDGAALAADGKRMLLIGGRAATSFSDQVWALDDKQVWTQPADIAPLPPAAQGVGLQAVVIGAGAQRRLVVFTPTHKSAVHWLSLATTATWQTLAIPSSPAGSATLDGEPACVVGAPGTASPYALVLARSAAGQPSAMVRFRATSSGVTADVVSATGGAPSRSGVMCALLTDGSLRVFGGNKPLGASETGAWKGTFGGTAETATSMTWSDDASHGLAQVVRSGGWAHQTQNRVVILGGYRRTGGGGDPWHRAWPGGPVALATAATQLTALDAPSPRPRLGAASGFAQGIGLCVAAGLGFDLPDEGDSKARTVPLTDAWCANAAGSWHRLSTDVPPYAFGLHGVDPGPNALVFASGLKLSADQAVPNPARLWRAGLDFRKSKRATSALPAVTDAVYRLNLNDGQVTTMPKNQAGPLLAAPGVVVDKRRRRILAFGGFNGAQPTDGMWVLDMKTMVWQDLGKDYPAGQNRPLPGYGQLVTYLPNVDTLLVAGGANYQEQVDSTTATKIPQEWIVVYQTVSGAKLAVANNPCYGPDSTVLWSVPTLTTPTFSFKAVPTFADLGGPAPPKQPLLRLQFGQPAFTPVLFDTAGQRGLLALQPAARYASVDNDGKACPGLPQAAWTDASVQVHLSIGSCNGSPQVFLEPGGVNPMPDSLVASAGHYDETGRRSWVWSGLGADGGLGDGLWSLSQTCTAKTP